MADSNHNRPAEDRTRKQEALRDLYRRAAGGSDSAAVLVELLDAGKIEIVGFDGSGEPIFYTTDPRPVRQDAALTRIELVRRIAALEAQLALLRRRAS